MCTCLIPFREVIKGHLLASLFGLNENTIRRRKFIYRWLHEIETFFANFTFNVKFYLELSPLETMKLN